MFCKFMPDKQKLNYIRIMHLVRVMKLQFIRIGLKFIIPELFRKDMSRKTLLIRLKDRFAEILRLHECFIIRRISRVLELD